MEYYDTLAKRITPAMASVVIVIIVLMPPLLCCTYLYLDRQGRRGCVEVQEWFIRRIIEKTLEEDYEWLFAIGNEKAAKTLIELKPQMTSDYSVRNVTDSSGYEYSVTFDNETRLWFRMNSEWRYRCPDADMPEEEILESMKLFSVEEVRYPTPTPNQ